MSVPSNHSYVTGGDRICGVMLEVLANAERVVEQQAKEQTEALHARMQSSAEAHPRWQEAAGDIEHWTSPNGDVALGVPGDSDRLDQAMRAEYGDATNAPVPLVRMGVVNGVTEMGWSMQEAFARFGY